MEPSDPRNPFFGLVERVLALASAAVAFPRALGYLEALAKKQPEPPPVERRLFAKPPVVDGARAGLLAALTSKPVLKKKTVDQGPLPPHLTSLKRRQAGERLDAELDALEGALAAAEAAIACARAHGDALRVHVGCAPHEDAVCSRVRTAPRAAAARLPTNNSRAGRGVGSRRAAEPPRRRVARAGAARAGDVRRGGRAAVENRRRRLDEVGAGRRRGAAAGRGPGATATRRLPDVLARARHLREGRYL